MRLNIGIEFKRYSVAIGQLKVLEKVSNKC